MDADKAFLLSIQTNWQGEYRFGGGKFFFPTNESRFSRKNDLRIHVVGQNAVDCTWKAIDI